MNRPKLDIPGIIAIYNEKGKKETHNEPVTITDNAYESLITDMLKEKLLEYSKYIKLNMSLHSCIINKAALKDAGYNVKIT